MSLCPSYEVGRTQTVLDHFGTSIDSTLHNEDSDCESSQMRVGERSRPDVSE